MHAAHEAPVGSSSQLTVRANGDHIALGTTTAFGLSGAVDFSASVTLARVTSGADIEAIVTSAGDVTSGGAIEVTADSTSTATATSDSAGGALVASVGITIPTAEVGGATLAQMNGDVDDGDSLLVEAISRNIATATSAVFKIGGLGSVAASSADATVTSGATTEALVGAGTIKTGGGAVDVLATSDNDAAAKVSGTSGTLGVGFTFMFPTAIVGGATRASYGGTLPDLATDATALTVRSRTSNTAIADVNIIEHSLVGAIGGASAKAEITSAADNEASVLAGASVHVSGAVIVEAIQWDPDGAGTDDFAANVAQAKVRGASGGILDAGVFVSNAQIGGAVLAELDGSVTRSASITVTANGDNDADATTTKKGFGGLGFSASATLARISSAADVSATVGTGSLTSAGAIVVTADSTNTADAISDAAGGSLIASVGVSIPTAEVAGATLAQFDANVDDADSLKVESTSRNAAKADADFFSFGLLGDVAAASADASVTSAASTESNVGRARSRCPAARSRCSRRRRMTPRRCSKATPVVRSA